MSKPLVTDLLQRKRDQGILTDSEIEFLVQGFSDGSIPDYQVSAWLMACTIRGLNESEVSSLTRAMRNSGTTFDWKKASPKLKNRLFADKHSTGGVGDKVSLILAPLAACLDLTIPMMSGRGLGHTGGTVDKLESIPGFNMFPSETLIRECLEQNNLAMMAQAQNLCPADKKLYHLRDVTGTVESIGLITASIVSKKWAEGAEAILYDVKYGQGAFMKDSEAARVLGHSLNRVSKQVGLKPRVVLTRMEEPLGAYIGNSLEVLESIFILKNEYPSETARRLAQPLKDLCLKLAVEMALLAGSRKIRKDCEEEVEQCLQSGRAWVRFESMCSLQGAHKNWQQNLPKSSTQIEIYSRDTGFLKSIDSKALGLFALRLGAGRQRSEDKIDPRVGLVLHKTLGDSVQKGEPLFTLHISESQVDLAQDFDQKISKYIKIAGESSGTPPMLIKEILE
jgi:pyrimidine-nucleoside phosphorylase